MTADAQYVPEYPVIEVVTETVDGYTDRVLQGVDALIDSTERAMGAPLGWTVNGFGDCPIVID